MLLFAHLHAVTPNTAPGNLEEHLEPTSLSKHFYKE